MKRDATGREYDPRANLELTGFTSPGIGGRYNAVRPRPPDELLDALTRYAKVDKPLLVVDVGCGTGLSTFVWSARAQRVIGVEPSGEMREVAEQHQRQSGVRNVEFRDGTADNTGLADGVADIVTVSQGFHYMEPVAALAEATRLLRPGGVFAAYDYDWLPELAPEVGRAYTAYRDRLGEHWVRLGLDRRLSEWDKDGHLLRIRSSGHFQLVREFSVAHTDAGSADRVIGLATVIGEDALIRASGVTDEALGLDHLRAVARRVLGDGTQEWRWTYRVRLGVR